MSERVRTEYRGCVLKVGHSDVLVYSPNGLQLGRVASIPTARALIRSYWRLKADENRSRVLSA